MATTLEVTVVSRRGRQKIQVSRGSTVRQALNQLNIKPGQDEEVRVNNKLLKSLDEVLFPNDVIEVKTVITVVPRAGGGTL